MHQFNFIGSQLTQLFWSNVIYVYNCVDFEKESKILAPIKRQTFKLIVAKTWRSLRQTNWLQNMIPHTAAQTMNSNEQHLIII